MCVFKVHFSTHDEVQVRLGSFLVVYRIPFRDGHWLLYRSCHCNPSAKSRFDQCLECSVSFFEGIFILSFGNRTGENKHCCSDFLFFFSSRVEIRLTFTFKCWHPVSCFFNHYLLFSSSAALATGSPQISTWTFKDSRHIIERAF